MSASYDHELMVKGLISWVRSEKSPFEVSQLYSDCTLLPKYESPQLLNGFRPDILAISNNSMSFLVADAKTSTDVESTRTRGQLTGFLEWLSSREKSYIVLGVPWVSKASAMSLLKFLIASNSYTKITPIVVDCSSWLNKKT